MEKRRSIETKGGATGLEQCDCNLFISWTQLQTHVQGALHQYYLVKKLNEFTHKCEECDLFFQGSLNMHKMDDNHKQNARRKILFLNQTKLVNEIPAIEQNRVVELTAANETLFEQGN